MSDLVWIAVTAAITVGGAVLSFTMGSLFRGKSMQKVFDLVLTCVESLRDGKITSTEASAIAALIRAALTKDA